MNQPTRGRLGRVLWAFVWFDLGLLIVLLPWSHVWQDNALLVRYPNMIPYVLSGYARGIVSGIGLLDMLLAADALLHSGSGSLVTRP